MTRQKKPAPCHQGEQGLLRLLDANLNRFSEALRTLEEYVRFLQDDTTQTNILKNARQLVARWRKTLGEQKLLAARDTENDVGTALSNAGERSREHLADVQAAAFKRGEEALRVLEEYGKLLLPEALVEEAKQARYALYTLEKETRTTGERHAFLKAARLMLIDDARGGEKIFLKRLAAVADAGLPLLQLRLKNASTQAILRLAEKAQKTLEKTATRLLLNDRLDIALTAGAFGVHLGQEDLPHPAAHAIAGDRLALGGSTHDAKELLAAEKGGHCDYVGFGPIQATGTKPDHLPPRGFELLKKLPHVTLPVFLIGGIRLELLEKLCPPFPLRVAISADILDQARPEKRVKEYLLSLKKQ